MTFETPRYPWGEPISPSSADYPLITPTFPGPGVDIWREYNRAELEWQGKQLRERLERAHSGGRRVLEFVRV